MPIGKDTLMQFAQVLAPKIAPGLPEEVPAANVAPKIANTIAGVLIALVGVGIVVFGKHYADQFAPAMIAKGATLWGDLLVFGPLLVGLVVIFFGGSVADPEVLKTVKLVVNIFKKSSP